MWTATGFTVSASSDHPVRRTPVGTRVMVSTVPIGAGPRSDEQPMSGFTVPKPRLIA